MLYIIIIMHSLTHTNQSSAWSSR